MRSLLLICLPVFLILADLPTKKDISVFTIGDSTMADKPVEVSPETGWCQVLQNFFNSGIEVKNHAVNGRSSKSFISEGRWQKVLESLNPGDYVFIQFGHNDEKIQDSTRYTTPFGTYAANLEKFVVESRAKGASPVLFTPIVRRKFGTDGKLTDTHGDYPVAVKRVAQKLKVPLIDLQKLTGEWVSQLGDEHSKTMFLWTAPNEKFPEGRKDDTHLSVTGASEVALLAATEIKKQNLSLSKFIR